MRVPHPKRPMVVSPGVQIRFTNSPSGRAHDIKKGPPYTKIRQVFKSQP